MKRFTILFLPLASTTYFTNGLVAHYTFLFLCTITYDRIMPNMTEFLV